MELSREHWVEYSWFNPITWEWSSWEKFPTKKAAHEHAHKTLQKTMIYKVQSIDCVERKV